MVCGDDYDDEKEDDNDDINDDGDVNDADDDVLRRLARRGLSS